MAKKKEVRKKKTPFKGFFDRILESLFESIEENTEDLLEKLGDIAFIKSTIKKYLTFFMFTIAALILFVAGLGLMINDFFPVIKLWMAYIGLGVILYIIGLINRSLK